MFCEKCGKQNDDDASFCCGCGTTLQGNISAQTVRMPAKRRSMVPLFIALSVVTVLGDGRQLCGRLSDGCFG